MNMRKSPPKQLPKECGIKIKAIDSDNAVAKCKNHNKMLRLKLNFIHIFLKSKSQSFLYREYRNSEISLLEITIFAHYLVSRRLIDLFSSIIKTQTVAAVAWSTIGGNEALTSSHYFRNSQPKTRCL